ncbi:MAG: DUF1844 domain-containing protein [Myxococcota bacterium]
MVEKGREQEESKSAFKVVDRRRFDTEGNVRQDVPESTRPPEPTPPPPPPRAAPQPNGGARAAQPAEEAPAPKAAAPISPEAQAAKNAYDATGGGGPAIDFLAFLQSLGQQALMQLGLIPYPDTGLVEPSLPLARQTIDILGMLQAKTRGNLGPKEERFMEALLYDLRMAYVKVTEAAMAQAMPPGLNLKKKPK